MEEVATARLLKWGNSYAFRITKRDVERLHLREGEEVGLFLARPGDRIEVPDWTFESGTSRTSVDHDEVLYGKDRPRR